MSITDETVPMHCLGQCPQFHANQTRGLGTLDWRSNKVGSIHRSQWTVTDTGRLTRWARALNRYRDIRCAKGGLRWPRFL